MEVTTENFKTVLPQIETVIRNATFLAIDCEFSGLSAVSEINAFDTPRMYYEKVRKNCRDFLVLQYGLSAFRFDENAQKFKQQSYNFYIFRRPVNRNILDQRFLCQTSSINFLTSQGFDFNKLFKSGIPYLNINEENEYREKLNEKQKRLSYQNQTNDEIPIPSNLKDTIDNIMKSLEDFLTTIEDEMELPKHNAFVRRLIYQTTAQKFHKKIILQSITKNKERILVAKKFTTVEEQLETERKLFAEEINLLDDFIGFTKVLRILIDSGKPIVGHNMCLDFLHTIDKFLSPLPEQYEEFKECAHSLFKNVIDTKFISSSDTFKDLIPSTILKDVLDTISKSPFEVPKNDIETVGYSLTDVKEHEAGYDAFITGICFITLWNYLGKNGTNPDFGLLKPFMNKLYIMLRDNQFINLDGADSNPSRTHVFYLTFPRDWKLSNITELFSPFGGVYVAWLNDSSAYVGLHKKEQAAVALSTLSQSDTYSIMTYEQRQNNLTNRKRTLEGTPKCKSKKLKIDQSLKTPLNKKTFFESDAWD